MRHFAAQIAKCALTSDDVVNGLRECANRLRSVSATIGKKAATTAAIFLIALSSYSQDAEKIKSLNHADKETAQNFANEITAVNYDYQSSAEKNGFLVFNYIPKAATAQQRQELIDYNCADCLKVKFAARNSTAGAFYRFEGVTAPLDDILPIWKAYFKPDVDKSNITAFANQEYIDKGSGTSFKLKPGQKYWTMTNWSQ